MTREEHIARHVELHKAFDELLADYIECTGDMDVSGLKLMTLMEWSAKQLNDPDEPRYG